jgi:arylesterase / paraoxonase
MQVIVRGPVPVPGPEDIVVDHAAVVAFSASQQRKSATGKLLGPADMPSGAIFALDLASEPLAKRLLIDQESLGFPFHPRGCSLFSGPDGQRRLMVISNRAATEHVVEVFDVVGTAYESVALQHVRTVADPQHLISPNDLVALDSNRFYVTNDHGARQAFWQTLETGIGLPWSTVVFWDGSRFHTVAKDLEFANGIALDHTRKRLYVAATRSKRLYRYPWDPADPAKELTDRDHIDLPGCPDNLEWDADGKLWIGADPSFLRLSIYTLGLTPTAPSLILRLNFDAGTEPHVEEVWHDATGEIISASSVAAVSGKGPVRRLLIGQPFGNHLLDCELRDATSG